MAEIPASPLRSAPAALAPENPARLSLGVFADDNQRLISVCGIFCAITAFTSTAGVSIGAFAPYLSGAAMAITLLFMFELYLRVPSLNRIAFRLLAFQSLLGLLIFVLLLHWFSIYIQPLHGEVHWFLFAILMTVYLRFFSAYFVSTSQLARRDGLQKLRPQSILLFLLAVTVAPWLIYQLTAAAAPWVDTAADRLPARNLNAPPAPPSPTYPATQSIAP